MAHAGPMMHQAPPPQQPMPKPPRKNPYRDGVSVSHQQYDLYEAIRNPIAPNRPPIVPVRHEKPLSKQKLLEKQIQEKFKKNNYTIPGSGYLLMGKVLKMIFMVLILPVYIILYSIPKWFFISLIPRILRRVDNFFTAIERRIVNAIKRFFLRLASPFITLWTMIRNLVLGIMKPDDKKQEKKLSDEPTGFFMFIAMGLFMMIKPFLIAVVWSYKATKKTVSFLRSLPMRTHYAVQNALKKTRQYASKFKIFIKKQAEKIRKAFHSRFIAPVQNNIFKPIRNWFNHKIDTIKGFVNACKNAVATQIKRVLNGIKDAVRNPKETAKKILLAFTTVVKTIFNKAYRIIRSWVLEKATMAKNAKQRFHEKLRQSILQGHKALHNYLKSVLDKSFAVFKSITQSVGKIFKNFPAKINALLKKKTDQVGSRVKILWAFIKAPIQIPIALYKLLVSLSAKVMDYLKGMTLSGAAKLKPLIRVASDIAKFLKQGLHFAKLKIKSRLSPFFKRWKKRLESVTERVRIILAWANVLLHYGMSLVAQTANQMGHWFS